MASNLYALAFCPPPDIVDSVRQHKRLLRRHIGWYHSTNSAAHITVATFTANSWHLSAVKRFAAAFCARRAAAPVLFDHFSTYANGAFFLAPDERSRNILAPIMVDFNEKMQLPAVRSTDPHITIARGLDLPHLYFARTLFDDMTPNLEFLIDGLSLRRLNEKRGQYDIVDHFPFASPEMTPNDCAWQGSLF